MEFIFDAHLDLSMNAIEWNRDYRLKTNTIRKLENGMNDFARTFNCLFSRFTEWQYRIMCWHS